MALYSTRFLVTVLPLLAILYQKSDCGRASGDFQLRESTKGGVVAIQNGQLCSCVRTRKCTDCDDQMFVCMFANRQTASSQLMGMLHAE